VLKSTSGYLIGPTVPAHAREMAAVLACGETALVSHRSAAHLYGLLPYPANPSLVHVTVTESHSRRRRGIDLHRTTALARDERRERGGVPVTAPVRSLVDFAASAGAEDCEQAVAKAFAGASSAVDRSCVSSTGLEPVPARVR
jgi:predicted transcriptional regulator of viral defense system